MQVLKYNRILLIFILFTIGCVNLPETTAENVEDSPTATIDIDATVMAMFEASNSKETVKKDPPADTEVNITSANAEQAVSVNAEATMDAFSNKLQGPSVPDTNISEGSNSKVSAPVYEYPTADPSLPTATSLPLYPTPTSIPKPSPTSSLNSTELLGGCDSPRLSLNIPSIILESETACRSIDYLSYLRNHSAAWQINTGVVLEWDVKTKKAGWLSSSSVDYYVIGMIHNTYNETYQFVNIAWSIYDKDGFLVDTSSDFIKGNFSPGDKMKIEERLYNISNGISKIKLTVFYTV